MKNTKKALLICLCLAAVAALSVAGTLAWLTDRDAVTNTFTVGQVDIKVDETKVDTDGKPVDGADRVQENEYHLLPGMRYTKDPTMTVLAGSEEAYVRMILTVHNASAVQSILDKYNLGDFSTLIGGWDPAVWIYKDLTADTAANTISFEFRYQQTVTGGTSDVALPALFTELIVPGQITGEEMQALLDGGFRMEISGHAIQTAGIDTEDRAWANFAAQNP